MDECEFCEVRLPAVEMTWTEDLKDLACKSCHEVLLGIEEYKKHFGVEYVLPKREMLHCAGH